MKTRYGDRVMFVSVYLRETHPVDGWRLPENDKVGLFIKQPRTKAERDGVAQQCCATLRMTMPLVVDEIDDRVGHAYSGMTDRLYIIDRHGKVVFKSGRGPIGFKPLEMEQSLMMLLMDQELASSGR